MKVLVAYESMRGHTRDLAETVGDAVRRAGHEADVKAMASLAPGDAAGYDAVAVGTWTKGLLVVAVGPAGKTRKFLESLPSLAGKRAGVFASYLLNPRGTLERMATVLEGKGAEVRARLAVKERGGDSPDVDAFVRALLG